MRLLRNHDEVEYFCTTITPMKKADCETGSKVIITLAPYQNQTLELRIRGIRAYTMRNGGNVVDQTLKSQK